MEKNNKTEIEDCLAFHLQFSWNELSLWNFTVKIVVYKVYVSFSRNNVSFLLINTFTLGVPRGILLRQPLCSSCFLPEQHLSCRVLLSQGHYSCIWVPLSFGDIQQHIWSVACHWMQSMSWWLLLWWTRADNIYQAMWWRSVNLSQCSEQ